MRRTLMQSTNDEIAMLKDELMKERRQRLDAEMELRESRQLTDLSNRAWDDWKPMITYLKGPPAVGARHMALAMTDCGSNPSELMEMLREMRGPPQLAALDMIHIIQAFRSERGMSVQSVQTLWTKMTAINGARWRRANLPEGLQAQALRSSLPQRAQAPKEILPEDRWLESAAKNEEEEKTLDNLTQYESKRRLKNLLASHEEYRSLQNESATSGDGMGAGWP